MLFNSGVFIFGFMPVVLLGFFFLARVRNTFAAIWLVVASLFFYGWWDIRYVPLLAGSVLVNYLFGCGIVRSAAGSAPARRLLAAGIAINLAVLGYYKYADFFVSNVTTVMGHSYSFQNTVLPLGISFFTFTQIAFLVDAYRGLVKSVNATHYGLFVTYFPHLIAGPVLHHAEMIPQFESAKIYRFASSTLAIGLTIFAIGLFKKVVLADGVGLYSTAFFSHVDNPHLLAAWGGALAFTLQLYLDFSGYSDMAIGLSMMFGIVMPINFNSPYKATNLIEFWHRWHMTLSRFLRDYLYIPLGGNRHGPVRRYFNLLLTMVLGGLWHGAGWTFLFWGALHGIFLSLNHFWRGLFPAWHAWATQRRALRAASWLMTFVVVVTGWVFFRASDLHSAISILKGMAGINGVLVPDAVVFYLPSLAPLLSTLGFGTFYGSGLAFLTQWSWIAGLLIVCVAWPNTQEVTGYLQRSVEAQNGRLFLRWHPSPGWAITIGLMTAAALLFLNRTAEFLYYQF